MNPLKTKKDLAVTTGMSVDYWDEQVTKRRIPHTRIGRKVFFTEDQIAQIIAMHAVEPKHVPTADEVSRKRNERVGRAA